MTRNDNLLGRMCVHHAAAQEHGCECGTLEVYESAVGWHRSQPLPPPTPLEHLPEMNMLEDWWWT